ncbi:hypothetical protein QJS66_06980 [Kocuria rhizophila]|nr:hypothetical protein QJS66_06980 [Kocuria rhizophila]
MGPTAAPAAQRIRSGERVVRRARTCPAGPATHRITRRTAAGRVRVVSAPFTGVLNFLVDITPGQRQDAELMGWLRGTVARRIPPVGLRCVAAGPAFSRGGGRALAVRRSPAGRAGSAWSWAGFCLLARRHPAVLNPAVGHGRRPFPGRRAASWRAATQNLATTTLTAVLAAPLLAGRGLWGRGGDLVATAVLAAVTAALRCSAAQGAERPSRTPRRARVRGRPGAWSTLPGVPAM